MIKVGIAAADNDISIAERCFKKRDGYIFIKNVSADIPVNRNRCVAYNRHITDKILTAKHQTEFDFDYFLSLDTDIEWAYEDVEKLLAHDKDIVAGVYQRKDDSSLYHAAYWGLTEGTIQQYLEAQSSGLMEVDYVPGGFTLIKRNVFEILQYPWFHSEKIDYRIGAVDCAEASSGDVGFCLYARRMGFKIYADCDCEVKHHKDRRNVVDEDLTKRMNELGLEKDEDTVDAAVKMDIVKAMVAELSKQEYQLKVSGRAAAAVENERQLKAILDQLEKIIKTKDYYKKLLEE